jgi:hypothetical protein
VHRHAAVVEAAVVEAVAGDTGAVALAVAALVAVASTEAAWAALVAAVFAVAPSLEDFTVAPALSF